MVYPQTPSERELMIKLNAEAEKEKLKLESVKGGDILDNRGGGILYHQGLSAQGKCHLGFIRG